MARDAGGTAAARAQRPHDNPIADGKAVDGGAELGHYAGHFVADDAAVADALVHVSQIDVQIRAADAAIGDIDAHLTDRWRSWSDRLEAEVPVSGVVGSTHARLSQRTMRFRSRPPGARCRGSIRLIG